MSIRKFSKNKFKVCVELGYDIFGKRKRTTKVINGSLRDAQFAELKMTKEFYHKGETTNINGLTFREYSEIFLSKYCSENVSLVTIKSYKQILSKIYPIICHIKLNKIDTFILDNMYSVLKKGEQTKVRASETMLHYYRLINVMLSQAVKWELIESNPNTNAIKPKREKTERRCYSLNQVEKLLDCLKNENIKYRTLITLAIDSGARRSEICALKWNDVDFENNTILIDNGLKVVNGIVDEAKVKNSYSNRKIIISQACIDLLKEYKSWKDDYKKKIGKMWKNENRIFTSKYGTHIHPDTCTDILCQIIKKYNLPKITFHELRHTCTSLLIDNGVNIKAVSLRLGHSNTNTTMNIYTHAYEASKQQSADMFDKILKSI